MVQLMLAGLLSVTLAAPIAAADTPLAINPGSSAIKWGPCPPLFAKGCQIAVLHGNAAEPNADVLLRVPGGFKLTPHRHTSAERMVLVGGRLRVRYQGSHARTLGVGHYAYGPAGMPHEAQCLGPQPCTLFIAFEGPVDAEAVKGPIR